MCHILLKVRKEALSPSMHIYSTAAQRIGVQVLLQMGTETVIPTAGSGKECR